MIILTKAIIALALGAAMIASPALKAEAADNIAYENAVTEADEKIVIAEYEAFIASKKSEATAKNSSSDDESAPIEESNAAANDDEAGKSDNKYEGIYNKNSDEDASDNTENKFKEIYDIAMTHASEILSLCAFIGSLVCAVIYKSGLLPMVENGLKSIRSVTAKIKEATDRAELDNKTSLCNINDRIDELEKTLGNATEALSTLAKRLEEIGAQRDYQEKISNLLGGEIDMLYDIFMSSNLPEYEKTRVGERVAKLKKDLNENEGE